MDTAIVERSFYHLIPKCSDKQLFFINDSKSWKVLSLFLELKNFILALSIEILKHFILILLLDGYMQVIKCWKISFLFFELEDFIFSLAMDILEGFIFVFLLKPIDKKIKDDRI